MASRTSEGCFFHDSNPENILGLTAWRRKTTRGGTCNRTRRHLVFHHGTFASFRARGEEWGFHSEARVQRQPTQRGLCRFFFLFLSPISRGENRGWSWGLGVLLGAGRVDDDFWVKDFFFPILNPSPLRSRRLVCPLHHTSLFPSLTTLSLSFFYYRARWRCPRGLTL